MNLKNPLALALVALLASSTALARPPGPPGPHGPPPPPIGDVVLKNAVELGLSEEVTQAVSDIAESSRSTVQGLREDLKDARDVLHDLLDAEVPDRGAALDQVRMVGDMETALRETEMGTMLDIRSLLTSEQWETLRETLHRGPGHHGPPPGADGEFRRRPEGDLGRGR